MSFHNTTLPKFIAIFAVGGPRFSTSIANTISGRELRNPDFEYSLQRYRLKNCILSSNEFYVFNSFFRARKGQNFAFRMLDYADSIITNQIIARGDDQKTIFPLFKTYHDPIAPYKRRITKPILDSVKIYINDNIITDALIDDNGFITLTHPLALNSVLKVDLIFEVAVRFSNDSFDYTIKDDGSIILSDIDLIEVID